MRRPRCSSVSSVCVRGLRAPRPNRRLVRLVPVVYQVSYPPIPSARLGLSYTLAYAVDAARRETTRDDEVSKS